MMKFGMVHTFKELQLLYDIELLKYWIYENMKDLYEAADILKQALAEEQAKSDPDEIVLDGIRKEAKRILMLTGLDKATWRTWALHKSMMKDAQFQRMFDEILRDHIICIEPNPMDPVPPWHIWKERKLREIEAQELKIKGGVSRVEEVVRYLQELREGEADESDVS